MHIKYVLNQHSSPFRSQTQGSQGTPNKWLVWISKPGRLFCHKYGPTCYVFTKAMPGFKRFSWSIDLNCNVQKSSCSSWGAVGNWNQNNFYVGWLLAWMSNYPPCTGPTWHCQNSALSCRQHFMISFGLFGLGTLARLHCHVKLIQFFAQVVNQWIQGVAILKHGK